MIVVSDTSPLNYLVLISAIELLPKLFDEIITPPQVIAELVRQETPPAVRAWAQSAPGWLQIVSPQSLKSFRTKLDPGEAFAISLARELRADAVLIDEKKGRSVVESEGLKPLGTVTVLQLAAAKKMIELEPTLRALQQTNFRISPKLVQAIIDADRKRKSTQAD